MILSFSWRLKIIDGKAVLATGHWFWGETFFAPDDNEIELRNDCIIFKRQEAENFFHELKFKYYEIRSYNPTIEELQKAGAVGEVERSLLSCLYDIISDYLLSDRAVVWKVKRRPFDIEYWKEKYKEYADILNSVDWSVILSSVPIKK